MKWGRKIDEPQKDVIVPLTGRWIVLSNAMRRANDIKRS